MSEQELFDAALLGESPPRLRLSSGCFVRVTESDGRRHCTVHVSGKAAETVCGFERADVIVDDDLRVMLRNGSEYKVAPKRNGSAYVQCDGKAEMFLEGLGGLGDTPYETVWRKGQMVVIAPSQSPHA